MIEMDQMNSGHDSGVVTGASSDEGDQQGCPHSSNIMARLVNVRIQQDGIQSECSQCQKYDIDKLEQQNGLNCDDSLWLCCTCGTQLCGKTKNHHALSHSESESKCHPVSLNTTTKTAWCYNCNKEYVYSSDSNVGNIANQLTTMQKKQLQIENQKQESFDTGASSSDEAEQPDCPHTKSVFASTIINKLQQNGLLSECPKCNNDNDPSSADGYEVDNTLWLCCNCGDQYCGRTKNSHALDHYKAESACHPICINTTKKMAWCYNCDKEYIYPTDSDVGKIADYITMLKNQQTKNDDVLLSPPPPPVPPIVLKISSTPTDPSSTSRKAIGTQSSTTGVQRVRGLTNLGNTCFFNAVLQCLVQTPFLLPILKQSSKAGEKFQLPGGDLNDKVIPPFEGELISWLPLTSTLAETLDELQTSTGGTYNPSKLFNTFVKAQPQFSGGDQHDSHELLRHLLDSVRNNDVKRYQKHILNKLGFSKTTSGPEHEEMAAVCKLYGSQINDRILIPEHVFRGFLVSTLTCLDCQHTSPRNESFLDISLPVNIPNNSSNSYESFARRKKSQSPPPQSQKSKKEKKDKRKEKKAEKRNAKKERKYAKFMDEQQKSEDKCQTPSSSSDGSDTESKSEQVQSGVKIEYYDSNGNRKLPLSPMNDEVTTNGDCSSPDSLMEDSELTSAKDSSILDVSQNQFLELSISDKGKERVLHQHEHYRENRHRTNSYTECNTTLAPPYQSKENECSIQSCLQHFTVVEYLTGNNKVGCDSCTQKFRKKNDKTYNTSQTKQLLISTPPAVMILHLKRFQLGPIGRFRKLSDRITFPLILDMAPFCASTVKRYVKRKQTKIIYSLYGVVEHSGGMHGGHYIAYTKVRAPLSDQDRRWKFVPKNSTKTQCDEQRAELEANLEKSKPREMRLEEDSDDSSSSSSSSSDEMEAEDNEPELSEFKSPPGKWYCASDSMVTEVEESRVLNAQAYLLFYERIY